MKNKKVITQNKIKAIIFDVGGVLELPNYSKHPKRDHYSHVHEYVVKKLKIPLDQYFDAIDTLYVKSIEGKATEEETIKIMSKNLKITSKRLRKIFIKAYKKNFKQNKELFKQVFRLRKQGYKIAILSDQWHLSKKVLIPKRRYKKFDEAVVSCDVGLRKPNPKIYKLILEKLKLKPKETIFIDNQEWNIKPAKKLGMKTILFKNNGQCFRELSKWIELK